MAAALNTGWQSDLSLSCSDDEADLIDARASSRLLERPGSVTSSARPDPARTRSRQGSHSLEAAGSGSLKGRLGSGPMSPFASARVRAQPALLMFCSLEFQCTCAGALAFLDPRRAIGFIYAHVHVCPGAIQRGAGEGHSQCQTS